MSPKELKKLAKACREAGIKHFKNAELEFTLTDDLSAKAPKYTKRALTKSFSNSPTAVDLDDLSDVELTDEQKMFYSAQSISTEESNS